MQRLPESTGAAGQDLLLVGRHCCIEPSLDDQAADFSAYEPPQSSGRSYSRLWTACARPAVKIGTDADRKSSGPEIKPSLNATVPLGLDAPARNRLAVAFTELAAVI